MEDEPTEDTVVEVVPEKNGLSNTVKVQITKFGAGKVSTGVHESGFGDVMAVRGEVIDVDLETAAALEAKGIGEIVE